MFLKPRMRENKLIHLHLLSCLIILHWLFQLKQSNTLSKVMQSIKSISAHKIGMPIWQSGYYDHALRKDEDIQTIVRYIVANPIRAGLVNKVGDYPHWDAIWL